MRILLVFLFLTLTLTSFGQKRWRKDIQLRYYGWYNAQPQDTIDQKFVTDSTYLMTPNEHFYFGYYGNYGIRTSERGAIEFLVEFNYYSCINYLLSHSQNDVVQIMAAEALLQLESDKNVSLSEDEKSFIKDLSAKEDVILTLKGCICSEIQINELFKKRYFRRLLRKAGIK